MEEIDEKCTQLDEPPADVRDMQGGLYFNKTKVLLTFNLLLFSSIS